jgi:hypothetical protein
MVKYEDPYGTNKCTKDELWREAISEAKILSQDAGVVWDTIKDAVDNSLLTLLVGDFITADQLRALYRTWEAAMGKHQQETSNYTDYGPQHTEIESLIERLKTITPEQAIALSNERNVTRGAEAPSRYAALKATSEADRDEMWCQATDEAEIASRYAGAVWDVIGEAVDDAILALLVGDLIDAEQFNALYGPWELVMDIQQEKCHHCEDEIRELVATLAIRDEQLAAVRNDLRHLERENRRWKKRAKKAEAKL